MRTSSADTEEPLNARFAILDARVSLARTILLQRRRRMIMVSAARTAADVAMPPAVLGTIAMLCHVTGWISPRPAWVLFAGALLVWMGFMIRGLWDCLRANVSIMDAAERMDLAGGSQNRFATAIEFSLLHRTDRLSALAIDDAIRHAQTSVAVEPVLPVNPPSARFKYELLGFLICLLIFGLGLRLESGGKGSRHPGMSVVAVDTISHSGEVDLLPRESQVRAEDIGSHPAHPAKPLADQTSPHSDVLAGAPSAAAQSPASSSAAVSASAQSNAGAQGAAAGQSIASAAAVSADHPNTPPMPPLAEDGSDSSQSESRGKGAAVSSGSPSDSKNPTAANHQPESQSQGDNKQPDGNSKQQNQNGGNSSGQKGQTKSTGTNAQGAENTESTGGGGSGSGQSGSKKSRGVGMGLLGVRTPDLFKGQELPGPEQQSALPAAPNSSNQIPASPSGTEHRQGDETSFDLSHIASDEEDLVNAYFSQLHGNK